MTIKAVLFDADGVVIFPWRFARYLDREHGITPAMTQGFFRGVFEDCLLGKADLRDALLPYLSHWGWEGSLEEFITTWFEIENAVDGRVVGVIRDLRRSGYVCGLATSQEQHRAAYMTTVMGFSQIFDWLFFSYQLGCQKPEAAYYERVAELLTLEGQHILFWDDAPRNVKAARRCGWNAEVFTDFDDFEKKLSTYLAVARDNLT
jgi:putative hydrolase of the HAD superfamily